MTVKELKQIIASYPDDMNVLLGIKRKVREAKFIYFSKTDGHIIIMGE